MPDDTYTKEKNNMNDADDIMLMVMGSGVMDSKDTCACPWTSSFCSMHIANTTRPKLREHLVVALLHLCVVVFQKAT